MFIILNEASKKVAKYQKKYKCPYCDKRYTRVDLVDHIDMEHQDMIPKGYTATRVVFNMINKKEHGTCVICGAETKWDEDKARYDRFCGKKSCHDKYVQIAHSNTQIEKKLKDPEFQQKMLAGRSISGTYKFSDGRSLSYTGTYEKKLLEFLDNFLHVKSYDVITPGPTIEYTYEGEKHFWITDLYYAPYNLVFDVKDGGDNPNRREMTSYREKQIAKEKAIEKQGKYNYIRLTNNNFSQLIEIMMELKELYTDAPLKKPIIRINENASMALNSMPPANVNNVYIFNYLKKNTFTGKNENKYGICKDYMSDAITIEDGMYHTIPFDQLKEMDITLYKYNGEENYRDIIDSCNEDTDFYEYLSGKELLDPYQIKYDYMFEEAMPYTTYLKIMEESIISTALSNKPVLYEGVSLPYFELEDLNEDNSNMKFYRDIDGVFIMNESTGFRTASYKDIDTLTKYKKEICNILR